MSARARPGDPATLVDFPDSVPIALAEEIERRLLFVSPDITGYELITDDAAVTGVIVRSCHPADAREMARKVNLVIDTEIRPMMVTPGKVIWRSAAQRPVAEGTFDTLVANGLVTEVGDGQVALGEPLTRLFDYLDRSLLGVLRARFLVTQYQYPTLIRTSTLQAAGYVSAFPHHVMFVTRLHNDIDVYRDVKDTFAGAQLDERLLASCRNVDYALPPTMCFHTFSQYRGRTIPRGGVHVVSARGKAFRYEADYWMTMERLWDFTIREIVFLGTRDEVLAAREQTMTAALRFLDELGVTGWCEVGNDPFFGSDSSDRIWSQRMMELKYELRLPVGGDRSIAVGSFNFHNDLFGTRFGIVHEDGGPVWSGCIGFGLERLTYAFVCQFGTDVRRWPGPAREAVKPSGA